MTKFMEQSCPCFLFLLFFIFWKVSKVILYLHTLCLTQNCYNCLCFFVFFSSLSSLFLDRLVKFFLYIFCGLLPSKCVTSTRETSLDSVRSIYVNECSIYLQFCMWACHAMCFRENSNLDLRKSMQYFSSSTENMSPPEQCISSPHQLWQGGDLTWWSPSHKIIWLLATGSCKIK